MTDFKRRIVTSIATGALLINALTPLAFADTTIEISGNGSHSDQNVNVSQTAQTNVTQNNVANVTNNVNSSANSGNNSAKGNTGGNVSIDTGSASTNTTVSNALNQNSANVSCCGNGNTTVNVSGNGSHSDNNLNLTLGNNTSVNQENHADVTNNVSSYSNSGGNKAKNNTGGDVSIDTGNASSTTNVSTTANANFANIGGGSDAGDLSVMIVGNGSRSDNSVRLLAAGQTSLNQTNIAEIYNDVDSKAKTGYNDAKGNTGGDVSIDTGNADANTNVDNAVNFNWADLDCGCLFDDVLVKVAGNGTGSDNNLNVTLGETQLAGQANVDNTDNDVESKAKTGDNSAKNNTGDPDGDPSIDTGDASDDTNVSNTGNVNLLNPEGDIDFPEIDFDVNFSLTWAQLLAWFSSHS